VRSTPIAAAAQRQVLAGQDGRAGGIAAVGVNVIDVTHRDTVYVAIDTESRID
jgi:hypothetical protein